MSTKKNTKASNSNNANTATGKGEGKVAGSAVTPTATPAPAEPEAPETPDVDPETPEGDSALTGDPEKDRLIVADPDGNRDEGEQVDEDADYQDISADQLPELHQTLCDAYPHIDHFFLTTDKQVFLPANKQYAKDHEKSLKTGDKIYRLSR